MPFRPIVAKLAIPAAVALCLAAGGCSQHADSDALTLARRHLRAAPCGPGPSVSGVAGVNENPHRVFLGDWVVLSVCHLDELLKTAEAEQQPLTLFIEGLDSGNQPTGVSLDSGLLTFELTRSPKNKAIWQPLLYNPLFDPSTTVRVSVGVQGERALLRVPGANTVLVLDKLYVDWTTWVWCALLAVLVVALLGFALRSDLLREGPSLGGVRRPYSLGRAQMAWWFFLILVGFVFIWLVTGDRDTIPPSLLALLGISAATALAAILITSRSTGQPSRRKLLDGEIASLDEALSSLAGDLDDAKRREAEPATGAAPAEAALASRLEAKRAALEATRAKLVEERAGLSTVIPSAGFWNDLVTDERGAVSLDRFQIVAWSLVLGTIFLISVVWDLTMPEFNATLLALMGISSGTYIGFKLPGKSEG